MHYFPQKHFKNWCWLQISCQTWKKIYNLSSRIAKSSIQITAGSKSGKLNINFSGTNAHILYILLKKYTLCLPLLLSSMVSNIIIQMMVSNLHYLGYRGWGLRMCKSGSKVIHESKYQWEASQGVAGLPYHFLKI